MAQPDKVEDKQEGEEEGTVPILVRRIGAQERYAQEILDHLWQHKEDLLETREGEEGLYYQGSIHMLVRRITPSGQAGDIVNILKESGAVVSPTHGIWRINREKVAVDEDGNPVQFDAPTFGHDSQGKIQARALIQLEKRIAKVEQRVDRVTELLVRMVKASGEGAQEPAGPSTP